MVEGFCICKLSRTVFIDLRFQRGLPGGQAKILMTSLARDERLMKERMLITL